MDQICSSTLMVLLSHACRKIHRLGKIHFIVGSKGRLTLCRRDEYGITDLNRRVMIKETYLYRELRLRLDRRKLTAEYLDLKKQGMLSWEAYNEHREDIHKSFGFLRRALATYKDRRIKAGLFYLCKHRRLHKVFIMSPLYTMPRKDALKKIRQILQKREAYASISNNGPLGKHGSNLARCLDLLGNIGRRGLVQLLLIYLFVLILACVIIFYD